MDVSAVSFRTYAHATEDPEKVLQAIRFVSGVEQIEVNNTTGFHGNPIKVLETNIKKAKEIDHFFGRLDREDVCQLLGSVEKRMDEDSFFYLRLDKQEAFLGRLRLADHDDVVAVRVKIISYLKKRENALKIISGYLTDLCSNVKHEATFQDQAKS